MIKKYKNLILFTTASLSFIAFYLFGVISYSQDIIKKRDTTSVKKDTIAVKKDTIGIKINELPKDTVITKDSLFYKPEIIFRKIPNPAFDVGEKLIFDVGYGFVTAGRAVMQIPQYENYNGRQCYKVEFLVNSLPFFSTFYKVEDKYVSLIDVEGIFPWRFEQYLREGSYKRDFQAEFDHLNGFVKTTDGQYPIEPFVHDVVSAFYFTRTIDYSEMRGGHMIHLKNFYKDTTYNLDVRFKGREKVKVEAGTFMCLIVEPIVEEGGLFKSEGTVYVWLTDDEKKIPVMVKSKILIGSISAELVQYSGIKGQIKAKVK